MIALKTICNDQEKSTKDIAACCMVTTQTARNWESGRVSPNGRHLSQLCTLLNVKPNELLMTIQRRKSQ